MLSRASAVWAVADAYFVDFSNQRMTASRPEVVRQAFCVFSVRLLRSGEPFFVKALRYVVSS